MILRQCLRAALIIGLLSFCTSSALAQECPIETEAIADPSADDLDATIHILVGVEGVTVGARPNQTDPHTLSLVAGESYLVGFSTLLGGIDAAVIPFLGCDWTVNLPSGDLQVFRVRAQESGMTQSGYIPSETVRREMGLGLFELPSQVRIEVREEEVVEPQFRVAYWQSDTPEPPATAEAVERGRQIYEMNCRACHPREGDGIGGDLLGLLGQEVEFVDGSIQIDANYLRIRTREGMPSVGMPGWEMILEEDEIEALVAYMVCLGGSESADECE